MGRELPAGTVTFLFTDVEGSTRLLHSLGAEAYADALAAHRSALRAAFARHGGVEVDTQGDALFAAFPTAPAALAAALEGREALIDGPIRVRMGLHTGTPHIGAEGYIGPDVHKGARIAAAGHGGQILVSSATAALLHKTLRDLGNHRLKDLDVPERIFQADPDEHPALKTLHQSNLPSPGTAFIGRSSELEGAIERLRSGTRLLTLTGPGGSGKTRLAIEAGWRLVEEAPDGVFWIGLAELTDPELALAETARAISAPNDLAEHIGDRRMVLVLDNLEQVLGIGPSLAGLLEACPNLRILVTSRERLRVRGEHEYPVPPLPETDAERLFVARAGVGGPEVAELCRRLDNLPLAVELAAARARVLSPQQILARLGQRLDLFRGGRDADARQQTLRGAIEWSHELLDAGERQLFARLGAFRGGWNLEAAEAVADAEIDTLASLVDKSLVTRTEGRFGMLETLRVFAEERLSALPDRAEVRARHLDHFIGLAESWYDARFASESKLLRLVDADTDNVRAAFEWALEHRPDDAVRLMGAVAPLWSLGGRTSEAKARLVEATERSPGADRSHARARTELAEFDDDVEGLREVVALWRRLGDAEGEAGALESLGWACDAIGDYAAAQSAYQDSLAMRERIGSPEVHGLSSRAGLCHVFVARARTTEAAGTASQLLRLARSQNAVLMEELALHFLADCSLVDGEFAEAESRYRTALACAHDAGLVRRATDEVIGVAMALAGRGQHARAVRLAAAAHGKQAEIAQGTDAWWRRMQDELLGSARRALSDAERTAAELDGTATGFERVVAELLAGAPSGRP